MEHQILEAKTVDLPAPSLRGSDHGQGAVFFQGETLERIHDEGYCWRVCHCFRAAFPVKWWLIKAKARAPG
jgi:hypothetical protein